MPGQKSRIIRNWYKEKSFRKVLSAEVDVQIDKIEWRSFGNYELPCPGDPEQYLNAYFGENWKYTAVTHNVDHKTGGKWKVIWRGEPIDN